MSNCFLARLLIVIVVVCLAPSSVAGQSASTAPQTPWGDPDLQGIWSNDVSTPLERPGRFADKEALTQEELARFTVERQQSRENRDRRDQGPGTVTDVGRAYNAFWFPVPGDPIARTSLIVDPPDGRIPAHKPEALERFAAWAATKGRTGSAATPFGRPEGVADGTEGGVDGRGRRADHPEDRRMGERCIVSSLPRLPGGYNNNYQIVQAPGYVVIEQEMHHHVRVIPVDGRPHLPQNVQQWMGDSRGRWEGDTLVVETTNFTDKTHFSGSFDGRRFVERFTRADANTLNYEFMVEDPSTWSQPWSAAYPLRSLNSLMDGVDGMQIPQMFEYACHEGNYGLTGQLAGARAVERATNTESR